MRASAKPTLIFFTTIHYAWWHRKWANLAANRWILGMIRRVCNENLLKSTLSPWHTSTWMQCVCCQDENVSNAASTLHGNEMKYSIISFSQYTAFVWWIKLRCMCDKDVWMNSGTAIFRKRGERTENWGADEKKKMRKHLQLHVCSHLHGNGHVEIPFLCSMKLYRIHIMLYIQMCKW